MEQNSTPSSTENPLLRCLFGVFLTSRTDHQLWDWKKTFLQFWLVFRYFQQGLCDEDNPGMPSPVLANSETANTDISSVFFAFLPLSHQCVFWKALVAYRVKYNSLWCVRDRADDPVFPSNLGLLGNWKMIAEFLETGNAMVSLRSMFVVTEVVRGNCPF